MKNTKVLSCRKCDSENIEVSDKAQMRKVKGHSLHSEMRLHAGSRCLDCGHEWWSRHKEALKRSRQADAKALAVAQS